MIRSTWSALAGIIAAAAIGLGCSSNEDTANPMDAGPVNDGASSDGPDAAARVIVETFNVALAGAFIPHEGARRQPLQEAIGADTADILCLQEVWLQSDKEAIAAATQQAFPHAVFFEHDLSTPLEDATDQNGTIPPPPSEPPCADPAIASKLDGIASCLAENCSTIPGSQEGLTTSTACAQQNCLAEAAALLFGSDEEEACYACAAASLPSSPIADIKMQCTTNPHAGLAFNGQSGVMILSKHPLQNARAVVIPGAYNRRVMLAATAQLPDGMALDVYCNHLTPIFDEATLPYVGDYGAGLNGPAAFAAEQMLQAEKLVRFVSSRSGQKPAVILGDMNAGRRVEVGGEVVLYGEGEATLDLLESSFVPAVTPDYAPLCTYCDTNPNTDTERPAWIDQIYLFNIGADAVLSTERTFDQAVVPVEVDDGQGGIETIVVPLSDHYALRAVLAL